MWELYIFFLIFISQVLNSESNKDADSSPSHRESEKIKAEVKRKKKLAVKEKGQKSQEPMKRKKPAKEIEQPRKKKKHPEESSVEKNGVQDQSSDESSGGKSVKVCILVFFFSFRGITYIPI